MSTTLDFSFSKPSVAQVKSTGAIGVIGYVSPEAQKNLTPTLVQGYRGGGLELAVVWEDTASNALGGSYQGQNDVQGALAQARALGYPDQCTIYFAVDFDATAAQMTAIGAYFRAVESVIGHARTGVYGPWDVLEYLHGQGLCSRYWQAFADAWSQWRNQNTWPGACLRQGGSVLSGSADINQILGPWGAWGEQQEVDMKVIQAGSSTTPNPNPVYVTDGVFKRYIAGGSEQSFLLRMSGQTAPMIVDQYTVDRMPEILLNQPNLPPAPPINLPLVQAQVNQLATAPPAASGGLTPAQDATLSDTHARIVKSGLGAP